MVVTAPEPLDRALEPDLPAPRDFFPLLLLFEPLLLLLALVVLRLLELPPVRARVVLLPVFRAVVLAPLERAVVLRVVDFAFGEAWRAVVRLRAAVLLVRAVLFLELEVDFLAVVFLALDPVCPPRPLTRAEVFFGVDLVLAADVRFFTLDGIILL